jgi:hypothetical protein
LRGNCVNLVQGYIISVNCVIVVCRRKLISVIYGNNNNSFEHACLTQRMLAASQLWLAYDTSEKSGQQTEPGYQTEPDHQTDSGHLVEPGHVTE